MAQANTAADRVRELCEQAQLSRATTIRLPVELVLEALAKGATSGSKKTATAKGADVHGQPAKEVDDKH